MKKSRAININFNLDVYQSEFNEEPAPSQAILLRE